MPLSSLYTAVAFWMSLALCACSSLPASRVHHRVEPEDNPPTALPIVEQKPEPLPTPVAPPPPPEPSDAWIDWVASHCLVDELGYTEYGRLWMEWIHKERRPLRSFMPPNAPRLNFSPKPIPQPGTPEARKRAEALRRDWAQNPRSIVIDCAFALTKRDCPSCAPLWGPAEGKPTGRYTAYLPKALLTDPKRVRTTLFLVPGGNGGRSRYFLTPIPYKGVFDKRSGGLEVKRYTDELLASSPDLTPPIVVALDSAGWDTPNGPLEFLARDAPQHFAETFLPHIRPEEIAVGMEGISSGSRMLVLSLWENPDAFQTLGLTCLHCGKMGADHGLDVERDLLPNTRLDPWVDTLRKRREAGDFRWRFVVGNRDVQWPCVKDLYDLLTEKGLYTSKEPTFSRCRGRARKKPNSRMCDTSWDDFHLYDRAAHNYSILIPSWPTTLFWHIETLSEMAQPSKKSSTP